MHSSELSELSLAELKQLQKDIARALKTVEARRISEARAELEAKAQELGVSLEAILGTPMVRKKSTASEPKYCHPENAALTWSGRGRRPAWIIEHEDNGGSREDFQIS